VKEVPEVFSFSKASFGEEKERVNVPGNPPTPTTSPSFTSLGRDLLSPIRHNRLIQTWFVGFRRKCNSVGVSIAM
jgi:hypothetical protein